MKPRSITRILGGVMCLFCGCDRAASTIAPPSPTSADLRFPVLLVWKGTSVQVKSPEEGIDSMHVNYIIGEPRQPVVIDSDMKIYDMTGLHTTKSGLYLMINPSATVPVEYKLTPHAKQGLDTARKLINDCQWLGGDSEEAQTKRVAIAESTTVSQMIAILQGTRD